jgi:Concanavalin A-like lectin/glucanases superfamily
MWINSNHDFKVLYATLSLTILSTMFILNFQYVFSQSEEISYLDVNSTNSAQLSKFSVAAWFKTSTDYKSDAFIVNKAGASDNMNYGIWMTNAEKVSGGFETPNGNAFFATSPLSYGDDKWHYVVVTFDGSTLTLYLDGLPIATKSTSGSPDSGGEEPIRMGANSQILNNFFIGNVDEIRVWKSALSAQQVIDAYNGNFNTKDLIEYLDFSEPIVPLNNTAGINGTSTNQTGFQDINGTVTNETGFQDINGTLTNETSALPTLVNNNDTRNVNGTGDNIQLVEIPQIINDTDTVNATGTGNQQKPPQEENGNINPVQQPNQAPKADAGDNQKAEVNAGVKLDGSNSSDEDGQIVSYKWEQTDGPEVDPKQSDEQTASFDVPPSAADSKLVFKLTVTDDKDGSGSDDVTVDVEQIPQDESNSEDESN